MSAYLQNPLRQQACISQGNLKAKMQTFESKVDMLNLWISEPYQEKVFGRWKLANDILIEDWWECVKNNA